MRSAESHRLIEPSLKVILVNLLLRGREHGCAQVLVRAALDLLVFGRGPAVVERVAHLPVGEARAADQAGKLVAHIDDLDVSTGASAQLHHDALVLDRVEAARRVHHQSAHSQHLQRAARDLNLQRVQAIGKLSVPHRPGKKWRRKPRGASKKTGKNRCDE